MKKLNKTKLSLQFNESVSAYIFLIPLIVGLIYFFLIPIVRSFLFSIGNVTTVNGGYNISLTGFGAYFEALYRHTSYRQTVVTALTTVLKTAPLIILFSFFIASVLNQEFKGKMIFRVILFLPAVMAIINDSCNALEVRMGTFSDYKNAVGNTAVSITQQFTQYMSTIGFGENIVKGITDIFTLLYGVVGNCAIQILIIFIGMQAISPALYEAANVEGATAWENFWLITFPMVSPMLFVCVIYTIVDSFTSTSGEVMSLISSTSFEKLNLSLGAAMGWIYFLVIGVLLAVVTFIFSRFTFYYDS